jgi:hypothetical protein
MIVQSKTVKMIVYGYKIDKENVVFQFELPKSFDKNNLKKITIAGTFNGWNPQDLNYKMILVKGNIYELTIPKSSFKDKKNEFKFVINGDNWQNVPENASNVSNGNLTLEVTF